MTIVLGLSVRMSCNTSKMVAHDVIIARPSGKPSTETRLKVRSVPFTAIFAVFENLDVVLRISLSAVLPINVHESTTIALQFEVVGFFAECFEFLKRKRELDASFLSRSTDVFKRVA
jgi:hypothetical protein